MQESTTMPGQVPANYREVLYWKLGENVRQYLLINVIAIPMGIVMGIFCFWLLSLFGTAVALNINLLWLLATMIVTLVLHELIHGLTMKRFGASPRYGVKITLLALYATAPGYAFTRDQFVQVALAPLVVITAVAVLGMALTGGTAVAFYLAVCATINATGACGDAYMTCLVRRYPPHAYVIDEADGIRLFMPAAAASGR